jgi:hypothetical protein
MRMMVRITLPVEKFNAAVSDGTVGPKLKRILDETKPEAAWFTEQDGQRGAILIVDVAQPSQIPALAEPWFLLFEANVQFRIAMTAEDLAKGSLDKLGKKYA